MYTNISQASPRSRAGFTLVELLVAIAIMGVLVGMVLFSLAGAQTDSKISRTKATIEKINSVILEEWEKYRYRAARIDIDSSLLRPNKGLGGQPALSPREGARLRMIVLRDLMRMEMPDRWTDILYPPTSYKAALNTFDNMNNGTIADLPYYAGNPAINADVFPGVRVVPGKLNIYRSQVGIQSFASPTTLTVSPVPSSIPANVVENQGAELLYMIVANANYSGGSALEGFRSSEIGDTDEDGLPEFLDAWGTPIRWLRWPSGFSSPLNTPYFQSSNGGNADAMDPLRTDWRWANASNAAKPWLLVPLVVSAGPDEVFDLTFDTSTGLAFATQTWSGTTNSPAHFARGPYLFPDPYFGSLDASGVYTGAGLGSAVDTDGDGTIDGATDNITNYSLILE
ncbi:MAG: type II secretion system protein [Aureliella sp.]